MKLYQIPAHSKLVVRFEGREEKYPATFHHVDGMYSICTLDVDEPGLPHHFHLYAATEMVLCGDHYEIARSN